MNIGDPDRNESLEDDGQDLSLFEQAMQEMEGGDTPENEYAAIRSVLAELSEKYGIEFQVFNGRALGQPMSLNHRLDDFRYRVGGISDEIAMTMQSNRFTREMSDEIIGKIMNVENYFSYSNEDLQRMLEATSSLIEVLLFLGESKYANEDEFVSQQRETMIADIKSYDLMLSTFHRYGAFLQDYIDNRRFEDNKPVNLNQALDEHIFNDDKDEEEMESQFKGYKAARAEVLSEIRRALSASRVDEILTSELREIVRAYRGSIGINFEGDELQAEINQKQLTNFVSLITKL